MKTSPDKTIIIENWARPFFYRMSSSTWVLFSIYMYSANEFFFSLTSILALIVLLFSSIKEITITNNSIEIEKKRILPFMSSKKSIQLRSLRKVEFEEGRFERNTVLVDIGRAIDVTRTGLNYIIFFFNDESKYRFKAIGQKSEGIEFVKKVNKMINNNYSKD